MKMCIATINVFLYKNCNKNIKIIKVYISFYPLNISKMLQLSKASPLTDALFFVNSLGLSI